MVLSVQGAWQAPRLSHRVASPLTEEELKGPGGKLGSAQQVCSTDEPESWLAQVQGSPFPELCNEGWDSDSWVHSTERFSGL